MGGGHHSSNLHPSLGAGGADLMVEHAAMALRCVFVEAFRARGGGSSVLVRGFFHVVMLVLLAGAYCFQ